MIIVDKLVYIEQRKTGSRHIVFLLSKMFNYERILTKKGGMHNAASNDQIASNTYYFVSSMRNPWDWYLSLWTFGVEDRGALKARLTKHSYHRLHELFLSGNFLGSFYEVTKDVSLWRDVYADSRNVQSFRKWLKLIHDPKYAYVLSEGYGRSGLSGFCGFMSHKYLSTCCAEPEKLKTPGLLSNYTDLVCFEKKNCYIDFFIRQESLEDDFCEVVEKIIRPLTQEEKDEISQSKKKNTSKRPFAISDYYDEETIDLVFSRDRLLIEKFGYPPPPPPKNNAVSNGNSAAFGRYVPGCQQMLSPSIHSFLIQVSSL